MFKAATSCTVTPEAAWKLLPRLASFRDRLNLWRERASLGVKPRTAQFHLEILKCLLAVIGEFDGAPTSETVTEWGKRLAHYCPSRWNAIVNVLQFAAPAEAAHLKRRGPRFKEFNPPSQLEFERLLQEADKRPRSQAGLIIRFLALSGLRFCEASRMTWADIRPDCIRVPAAISKNGKARCIPLLPGIEQVLERLRSNAGPADLILDTPHARKAIRTACRQAGIGRLSYHSFRHLFATRCIESGVDVPTVARWLGHQDGGALLSRMYFHLLDDHSCKMAAKVRIV